MMNFFFIALLCTSCASNYFLRSETFLARKQEFLFSNSQTNPYELRNMSDKSIAFNYSFIVKNDSTTSERKFSTADSVVKVNTLSIPIKCVHFSDASKTEIHLKPKEYARFECSVKLTANNENQLLNKDTTVYISIPLLNKEEINFPYKLRIEDFED